MKLKRSNKESSPMKIDEIRGYMYKLNAMLVVKYPELMFDSFEKMIGWDEAINRIDNRLSKYNLILEALKLAYRKHHIMDDSIGWEELSEKLRDALCEAMGDEEYQQWLEENLKKQFQMDKDMEVGDIQHE